MPSGGAVAAAPAAGGAAAAGAAPAKEEKKEEPSEEDEVRPLLLLYCWMARQLFSFNRDDSQAADSCQGRLDVLERQQTGVSAATYRVHWCSSILSCCCTATALGS